MLDDSKKIKGYSFLEDERYEGKNEIQLDEDRFINEGLSGGRVHMREDTTNIGEATPIHEEEPPRRAED